MKHLRISIAEIDGDWGLMITLPGADEDDWYWLTVDEARQLRALIDELIEHASSPPPDAKAN